MPPSGMQTDTHLTSIVRPTTAGINGVTGSFAHKSSFQWDYTKGQLTVATDENGKTSRYTYNDTWNRPTEADFPDNGKTTFAYGDAPPQPWRSASKYLNASGPPVTTTTVMDARGHAIQTQLNSDPSGTIYTDTVYDGMERPVSVSNPYRLPTGDSTNGYTTTAYDALNRKVTVTEPDGAVEQWAYSWNSSANATGEATTFTDAVGDQWLDTSDALGRLIQVLEPNGVAASPSMETDYTYDGLNNLATVKQYGGPSTNTPIQRSFLYDALSRLKSATNPESGTTTYTYDANSNLKSKSDSAGIVTTYCSYDALNRPECKTYSDGTPGVYYSYDGFTGATNAVGKLTNETVMKGSTLISQRSPYQYDPMGRLLALQQCSFPQCSSTSNGFLYLQHCGRSGNVIKRRQRIASHAELYL